MRTSQINIFFTAGVVALLLLSGCVSGIISNSQSTMIDSSQQKKIGTYDDAIITCSIGGIPHSQTISYESGIYLKELFSELVTANAQDPSSSETQHLQQQILQYADQQGLLPAGISADMLSVQFEKRRQILATPTMVTDPVSSQGTSQQFFCNFVSTGQGSAFPIIILPRFIPIVMAPIPRLFVGWKTPLGITSCGGLRSGTGFIASGQQQGLALGFWGIGFSIFLPPVMAYGMFGYALYAKVSAEDIEYWPPNNPPEITQTNPADGQQFVPVTTAELRFEINDMDNDLMSYNVTTEPNIGSGSGGLKPGGTYSIPISGLESLTNYSWSIQLTDGKDTVTKICSFVTEPTAPKISSPSPEDGERDVPMNIPQLQFTLRDYQGDAMEYTVQTSPNIGSQHETSVHDGTYTVPISGMAYGTLYRWYVNVTDGTHWARKTYSFTTGYPSPFDPFDYGWQYRKQITVDPTQVTDDLDNFPVLISTTDTDFMKAQADGDDILFMNGAGAATKLRHELEDFNEVTGTLIAWVNIPSLSSEDDTVFYMYYGNPNCINQEYPEKVWNNQYNAVWHLNTNPTGNILDSTAKDNDGTPKGSMTSSDLVNGKIGPCLDFDGIDDSISFAEFTESLDTGTCIAWVQTTTNEIGTVWGEGNINADKPYIVCGKYYDDKLWFARDIYGGSSNYQGFKPIGMNDGQWHQVAWLSKGTGNGNTFYFDGQPVSLSWQDSHDPNGMWFDDQSTDTSSIGALDRPTSRSQWNGLLDEIRITDSPLSSAWIATEFTNQNNPSGFLSIGPEEPGP